jgi:hypothetical protein
MRELHLPTASRHAVTARHPRYLVNTGRKLTPFHRSKTDPPSRVTDRAA